MSSDEGSDDGEGRIRFSTEGDYDEGQWIDGEFMARGGARQGRSQTREEQLYGVFHEEALDGTEGGGGRRGGGGGGGRRGGGKGGGGGGGGGGGRKGPVAFVASKKPPAPARPQQEEKGTTSASAEANPTRTVFQKLVQAGGGGSGGGGGESGSAETPGLGSGGGGGGGGTGGLGSGTGGLGSGTRGLGSGGGGSKPKPNAALLGNVGQWEKHTKGFGLRMLMKQGFTGGGLGKEGKGISRHVETAVRPQGAGLGMVKEITSSVTNRKIEAELHGKVYVEPEEEEPAGGGRGKGRKRRLGTSHAEEVANKGGWRKGGGDGGAKKKRQFVTVNDVLAKGKAAGAEEDLDDDEEEPISDGNLVVVDMRGPETKLLSSMDGIDESTAGHAPRLGQELLHNLNLHVDLARAKLTTVDRQRQAAAERRVVLAEDEKALAHRVAAGQAQIKRFRGIESILQRLEARVSNPAETPPADEMLSIFRELKSEEFKQEQMSDWNPLAQPERAVNMLLQWKPLLLDEDESTANPVLEAQNTALFDALAEQLVVRKIQTSLTNEWDVHDARPCVTLIEGLKGMVGDVQRRQPLLSQAAIDNLVQVVIFPKLKRAVERWNPSDRQNRAGEWICPWLPHMQTELASLMPSIRRKLAQSLDAWKPEHNAEQRDLLKPWMAVFDRKTMDSLSTHAAGRLALQLRAFEVNPAGQQGIDALRSILAFSDVLPTVHMTSLLQGELFPKWKAVLYDWIRQSEPSANADIVKWYRQWKALIFEHVPRSPQLNGEFSHGLDLMEKGRTLDAAAFEQLKPDLWSYPQALKLRHEELAREGAAAAAAAAAAAEESGLGSRGEMGAQRPRKERAPASDGLESFKEVVASFAEEHGVAFVPKQRQHNGFRVYSFGGASVYLDKDVCHVESGGSQWHPIGFTDLLEYASSKKAGGRT